MKFSGCEIPHDYLNDDPVGSQLNIDDMDLHHQVPVHCRASIPTHRESQDGGIDRISHRTSR